MQGSRRAGIALLGAVLALGVAPGLASACERPDSGDLGGGPAYAGDTVTIALPSGCEGAYWSVSLEGAETNGAGGSLIFTSPTSGTPRAR